MPAFTVSVEVNIQIVTNIEIKAKDEEAAEEKAQNMIDKGRLGIHWEPTKASDQSLEWEEASNETVIESCERND